MALGFNSIVAEDPVDSVDIELIQQQVKENFTQIADIPFMDGVHKIGNTLGSGDNSIGHGLNREYLGMIVTRQDGASNLYVKTANTNKNRVIIVNSSAAIEADLWIF